MTTRAHSTARAYQTPAVNPITSDHVLRKSVVTWGMRRSSGAYRRHPLHDVLHRHCRPGALFRMLCIGPVLTQASPIDGSVLKFFPSLRCGSRKQRSGPIRRAVIAMARLKISTTWHEYAASLEVRALDWPLRLPVKQATVLDVVMKIMGKQQLHAQANSGIA